MKRFFTGILAIMLCLTMFAGCSVSAPATETPASTEAPAQAPAATEDSRPEPTAAPAETPAPERIVKEDYVFEGPGIVTLADQPESYKQEATQMGTVETVTYNNGAEEKYFNIYMPYGYASGTESYNVLYLMHGGNGRPEVYLQPGHSTGLQKMIDNMIQNGDIKPLIVVAPTWNSAIASTDASFSGSGNLTKLFVEKEFAQYVLPLVDGNYRTNATRDGRAFGGFSMGGVTTWYTFLYDLVYVRYFAPFSGDCWIYNEKEGATQGEYVATALADAVKSQGYTSKDFLIYCCTGTQDIAIPNLAPQIYAMQKNEMFLFGENTFFGAYPDATHSELICRTYLYNALPHFWMD